MHNDLQQQFQRIEQCVEQVSQFAQMNPDVNQNLKECLWKLDQRSDEVKALIERRQLNDESQFRHYLDELEQLSDQALQACRRSAYVGPQLKDAIVQAHQELSQLKHQLH